MEIREVLPDECAEAGEVVRRAYLEFAEPSNPAWGGYLPVVADVAGRAGRVPVLVAVGDGQVLGCVTLELDEQRIGDDPEFPADAANVRMLGVLPEARGRGIGRALMEACADLARSRGKRALLLHTTRPMRAARSLYRSMGFERDPDRDWDLPEEGVLLLAYRLVL